MKMSLFARSPVDSGSRQCLEADENFEEPAAFWRINGHRARLVVWTSEEWTRLKSPPSDAQYHPAGVWCALRVE